MTSQRRRSRPTRPTPKRVIGRTNVRQAPPRKSGFPMAGLLAVGGAILIAAVFLIAKPFGGGAAPGGSIVARGTNCPTSQPAALPTAETRTVTITTPKGDIVVKVQGSLSPIAAGNFVTLASCGFYDGIVFHRTAAQPDGTPFVIQGGDPNGTGGGGPGYTIQDEPITAAYKRGTVAMARTSAPNSQGSQFFIVLDDAAASALSSASPGYAIFGEVASGMDVADAIFQASGGKELPSSPIPMTKVTVANP
jgi:cyclophilin family peptidyl-prolyl cis-trans isomerase